MSKKRKAVITDESFGVCITLYKKYGFFWVDAGGKWDSTDPMCRKPGNTIEETLNNFREMFGNDLIIINKSNVFKPTL